jgi:hypothetical protein
MRFGTYQSHCGLVLTAFSFQSPTIPYTIHGEYDAAADRSSATTRQPSYFVNMQTGVKELPALPNTINIPKQELSFLLGSDFHFVFTYTIPNSPQNSFVSCSRKSSLASSCSSRLHFKSIIDPPICM